MEESDFVSSAELQSLIINRRKNVNGDKINWFDFRRIIYRREEPFFLTISCANNEEQKISLKKKNVNDDSLAECNMPCLFPGGRAISNKKHADLMHLLKYIPQDRHAFFEQLKCDDNEDYGLASDISDD